MPEIYSLAERVVIWLGPEGKDSPLALSTLQHLGNQFEGTVDGCRFSSPDATELNWFHRSQELPYNEETWAAIYHLLLRPWFTRLWIVQEAALANRMAIVQCGTSTILLSELRRAVLCLRDRHKLPSPALSKLLIQSNDILSIRQGKILDDILMNTRHQACSKAKDCFYAILGILPIQFASKVPVCYDESLSTGQLYRDVFLLHYQETHRLDLFKHCDVVDRVIQQPSWVPDLSARRPHAAYIQPQFSAGYSSAQAEYREPQQLWASGIQAATVSYVSDRLPTDWTVLCAYVHQRVIEKVAANSSTTEAILSSYALAISGGRVEERWPNFGYPSTQAWSNEVEAGSRADQPQQYPREVQSAIMNCQWRRLVETDEGHVGVAPDDTRTGESSVFSSIALVFPPSVELISLIISCNIGDHVVVLLGSSSPLVLRPQKTGLQLIGECFIDGLTDTTSFLGPLPHPWKVVGGWGRNERYRFHYLNVETSESTLEDPRLTPFGSDWERIDYEPDGNDPEFHDFFRHKITGKIMNSNPRLLPEMLLEKGVTLTRFCII
jgi:hypothetical protein